MCMLRVHIHHATTNVDATIAGIISLHKGMIFQWNTSPHVV
jgi:hypothetical protein